MVSATPGPLSFGLALSMPLSTPPLSQSLSLSLSRSFNLSLSHSLSLYPCVALTRCIFLSLLLSNSLCLLTALSLSISRSFSRSLSLSLYLSSRDLSVLPLDLSPDISLLSLSLCFLPNLNLTPSSLLLCDPSLCCSLSLSR